MRLLAITACLLGLLACTARAMPAPNGAEPSRLVSFGPDVLDPPDPAPACPSLPASLEPIAACPIDLSVQWDGKGDEPRCNYDSGSEGDPCPHSRVGDPIWYFRCGQGSDPDTAGTVGVEFGWPETEQEGRDDVTSICAGSWESLSL